MQSEFLCNRRCNLNKAEETVKFISEKLQVQTVDGQLDTDLLGWLKDRYIDRRSKDIVSLYVLSSP